MTPQQAQRLRIARDTLPRVPITGPFYDPRKEGVFCSVGHMAKVAGVNVDSTAEVVNERILSWTMWSSEGYGIAYDITNIELEHLMGLNEETSPRWRRHEVVKYINKLLTDNGHPINAATVEAHS